MKNVTKNVTDVKESELRDEQLDAVSGGGASLLIMGPSYLQLMLQAAPNYVVPVKDPHPTGWWG